MEGIEEHRVIQRLLAELEGTRKETEQWTAKLTVLEETVEHHVEEEECDMFKKATKVLSARQREELGEQMAGGKKEA